MKGKVQTSLGICLSPLTFEPGLAALGPHNRALEKPSAHAGSLYTPSSVIHPPSQDGRQASSLPQQISSTGPAIVFPTWEAAFRELVSCLILACYVQLWVDNRTELFGGMGGGGAGQSSTARGEGIMTFWRSGNFPNNLPKPSPCWSVCSLKPIHNRLFGNMLLKPHYPGETDLGENWLPCPGLLPDKSVPAFPRHTPPHSGSRGESQPIQHHSQALFLCSFIRSTSYARLAYWLNFSVPSNTSQESNATRQPGPEKPERGFAWNQGFVMIFAGRKEDGLFQWGQ